MKTKTKTITKIKVRPEGRDGLFLLEVNEAVRFIESLKEKLIHSFTNSGNGLFLGCDWNKKEVIQFLKSEKEFPVSFSSGNEEMKWEKAKVTKIAMMILPDSETMKHQLVALTDDTRYSFDVGELTIEDLEIIKD